MTSVKEFQKWRAVMPDENKETRFPETNFLPPLNMVLTFFDKAFRKRSQAGQATEEENEVDEKSVEKLIEKLSEKEKE